MRIAVTGGDGFVGRNLRVRLGECGHGDVVSLTRDTSPEAFQAALAEADFVYHLAGVNRPPDPTDFEVGNAVLTEAVCDVLAATGRAVPLVLTSSAQAAFENPYGRSKRRAEAAVERYGVETGAPWFVLRLPNVFGKWSRPDYNSAVATFCHHLARGLPITVHDATAPLRLLYVDDLLDALVALLTPAEHASGLVEAGPVHESTVGDVASILAGIAAGRRELSVPHTGSGLTRALYATYLSFLPVAEFTYPLAVHSDARGSFAEMLRTPDCGQVSFFTAHPGVTRGGHYHHTKSEKFLVVQGRARFGFRNVITGERHELIAEGSAPWVVETVPGWVHDVTNIGSDQLVVLLWANETFDPGRPDVIAAKVEP